MENFVRVLNPDVLAEAIRNAKLHDINCSYHLNINNLTRCVGDPFNVKEIPWHKEERK